MNGVRIASAGAGTGKTYFLTQQLTQAIAAGLAPSSIMATTFTRKAAGELRDRVRRTLLEQGRSTDAQRIFEGYIGTVHSVCARLLSEYAIDAGLSPALDVMPEGDDTRFFRIATASIVESYAAELEPPAFRLGRDGGGSGFATRPDWRDDVRRIVDLARANGIEREALREGGRRSATELVHVLSAGTDREPGDILAQLEAAADEALVALAAIEAPKQNTAKARDTLQWFLDRRRRGEIVPWEECARIAKLTVNKDAGGVLDSVCETAAGFVNSEAFRLDLEKVVHGVVDCAADTIDAYRRYKTSQGVMDYTDQESLVLRLARENDRFREGLRESLGSIFVDEFQDTSPIQLALFLALHEICGTSRWVGDPKQAIYGFRGTDPALMNEAVARLGTDIVLRESWRSSERLVSFTNAVFQSALEARGYRAVTLAIPEQRTEEARGGRIETWYLNCKNKTDDAGATAAGIAALLAERDDLKPGEIAVLCRTNAECSGIAEALSTFGIDASVGHGILSQTAECRLAIAALRYLSNVDDTLALAEIVHTHPDNRSHGAWLAELIDAPDQTIELWRDDPIVKRLDEARDSLRQRSPDGALETAIGLVNLPRLVASWSRPERRRANLESLRGVCNEYLASCAAQRSAATVAGFIGAYDESETMQATGTGPDTVQVLTYHGAKGLEWNVVVLTSLDSGVPDDSRTAFGVNVESARSIDLDDPLADRTIRYWPWPFGAQKRIDGIAETIAESPQHLAAVDLSRDEALRLLYVGMTRARRELVLAIRLKSDGTPKSEWLDELTDAAGKQVIEWPRLDPNRIDAHDVFLTAAGKEFETTVRSLDPIDGPASQTSTTPEPPFLQPLPATPEAHRAAHPPAHISPSALEESPESIVASASEVSAARISLFADLGDRIPIRAQVDDAVLGTAIHAVFAAAYPGVPRDRLKTVAERVLARYDVAHAVSAADLLEGYTRLERLIALNWPDARVHREWPVSIRLPNGQRAHGWIDLLLETDDGPVIIDHKTFPGRDAAERITRYVPQLSVYRQAIEAAGHGPVRGCFIHLPVLGEIYEVGVGV